jgi:hypothetical protein
MIVVASLENTAGSRLAKSCAMTYTKLADELGRPGDLVEFDEPELDEHAARPRTITAAPAAAVLNDRNIDSPSVQREAFDETARDRPCSSTPGEQAMSCQTVTPRCGHRPVRDPIWIALFHCGEGRSTNGTNHHAGR